MYCDYYYNGVHIRDHCHHPKDCAGYKATVCLVFFTPPGAADSIRGAATAAVFAKVDNPSHTLFHTSPAHLRVVIFCVFRIVHCTFQCSRCVLRVAGCALRVARCELRAASCALRVARCDWRAAIGALRFARCALCFSFILQKERKAVIQKKKQRRKRRRRQRRERSEKLIRGEKMRRLRTASTP